VRRSSSIFSLRSYFKDMQFPPLDLESLLTEIFINNGRLLHHERLLCFFPEYLQLQFKLINELMNMHTVLPVQYRYYLSIMAVSCYNCDYLLKILEEQFILNEGNPKWLKYGLKSADSKLRAIAEFNELLAHRPWVIYTEEIKVSTGSKQFLVSVEPDQPE
jgi:sestrin